jgi:hypothetical protein
MFSLRFWRACGAQDLFDGVLQAIGVLQLLR